MVPTGRPRCLFLWSEPALPPFTDEAYITNTYSNNGDFSLAFNINPAAAGPEDVVLPLSHTGYPTPYVAGVFTLTQNLYITTGAYFNFQAEDMPGVTWALDVTFDAMGGVNYASSGSAQSYLMSTYPTNQWFEQQIVIDLSNIPFFLSFLRIFTRQFSDLWGYRR